MPDFTYESYYHCQSAEYFTVDVQGKKSKYKVVYGPSKGQFQYDYTCNCPSFKFSGGKRCKHIEEAIGKHCNWLQFIEGGEPVLVKDDKTCPKCGLPVIALGGLLKQNFDKHAEVVAHIGGVSGAGKTTLLEKLQAAHPGVITKDLDEIDHDAKKKMNLPKMSDSGPYTDDIIRQLTSEKQKMLDAFVAGSKSPVVMGGIHFLTGGGHELNIPAKHKLVLDTSPAKGSWRAFHREREGGRPYGIREILDHYFANRQIRRDFKAKGYQPASADDIFGTVSKELSKHAEGKAAPVGFSNAGLSDIHEKSLWDCEVKTGLIDDVKIIKESFVDFDHAKEFVESVATKKLCKECNALHYQNSFCESCGACLYKNSTVVDDHNHPLCECTKCKQVNYWD